MQIHYWIILVWIGADGQDASTRGSVMSDDLKPGKRSSSSSSSPAVDGVPRQPLVLLCSEKAAYIYSFVHAVQVAIICSPHPFELLFYIIIWQTTTTAIIPSSQGLKKVLYKKKFHSSCCWASTFYTTSDVALFLVFGNGKIEIRCCLLFTVPQLYEQY